MIKISVIIPTYKPQSYLGTCLDSLCAQTFPKNDFEVILVLNGCKDPYDAEIRDYVQRHEDIQFVYLQTNQGGVSNARNMALDVARGEFVAFIDDDDYVSPSYLQELYDVADKDTIALAYPYAFNDGDTSQLAYPITDVYKTFANAGKQRFSSKVRRYFNGPWMKLIPVSFIQKRRFDVRFSNGEDSLFMFLISDKFKYVDFTSDKAIYYRRYRIGSAVTSKKSVSYVLKNTLMQILTYSTIYFKHPFRYSCNLYVNRICACLKTFVLEFWNT